ncbi:MAG: sensor domain-containing protein [Mycolicibacterium cosmeticum]|nr:sensor domain-containing protein [Mycolicibacterium cosmeticum]
MRPPRVNSVIGVLACALALTGCTRFVDTALPQAAPRVGPIIAAQVGDLLSEHVQSKDGNRFVTVEPASCAGVAREQDAPFIVDRHPVVTDGGHWVAMDGREVYIEEIAAVYPSDFDPKAALVGAHATIESCRGTPFLVTSMKGREYHFTMDPRVDPDSPSIVAWSFHSADWGCDNAFVAAYNAAVEITACGPVNGYDVGALAKDTLKRIELLVNTTA